jgi:hypothetical protein
MTTSMTTINDCNAQMKCAVTLSPLLTSSLCSHSHCAGPHSSCARAADRCRPPLLCEIHQQRWRHTAAPGCRSWARRCGAGVGQCRSTHRCTRQGELAAAECVFVVVLFALSSSPQLFEQQHKTSRLVDLGCWQLYPTSLMLFARSCSSACLPSSLICPS